MKIIPLDKSNIKSASNLADTLFSYARFTPSEDFKASLDPILFKSYQNEHQDTLSLKYWVAVDERDNTVIGTTGLYELKQDRDEAYWVGWFCVSPRSRGKGIGKKLLHFTINQSTIQGKKFLRLYTSTNRREKNAQTLYEANDLRIDEARGRVVGRHNQIFYREKILNIIRPANNKELEQVKALIHCPELANATENFFTLDIISEYLEDGFFFVAEKGGIIAGTILGERIKGNGLLLRAFSVKQQYREQGIGTQLFKTLEKKCAETGIKWMLSYVSVKNLKTTTFFRDASFQKGPLFREHMKNYP